MELPSTRTKIVRFLVSLSLVDVLAAELIATDNANPFAFNPRNFLQLNNVLPRHGKDASRLRHKRNISDTVESGATALSLKSSMRETFQVIRSCEMHFDTCWRKDEEIWGGVKVCGASGSVCQALLCTKFLEANCTSMISMERLPRCAEIENMCVALQRNRLVSHDQKDPFSEVGNAMRLSAAEDVMGTSKEEPASTGSVMAQEPASTGNVMAPQSTGPVTAPASSGGVMALKEAQYRDAAQYKEADSPISSQATLLHIPKTGGTAIEEAAIMKQVRWGMYLMQGRAELARHGEWHWFCQLYHTPPALLEDASVYEKSETFCVTRHPYERAISEYTYMLSVPWGDNIPEAGRCEASSLNSYLQEKMRDYSKGPYMKYMNDCHFIPQSEYIWGKGKRWCHDVFRFQDFPDKFNLLMRSKGSNVRVHADHRVNAFHDICPKMSVSMLNNETLALLQQVYKNDFEPLGYRVDGGYFETNYSKIPPEPTTPVLPPVELRKEEKAPPPGQVPNTGLSEDVVQETNLSRIAKYRNHTKPPSPTSWEPVLDGRQPRQLEAARGKAKANATAKQSAGAAQKSSASPRGLAAGLLVQVPVLLFAAVGVSLLP